MVTNRKMKARASSSPLGESLIIAWPQIVGLISGTIILFVAGYVVFQRQEVRA
jgi:ABC-2 type transport system permease protein